MIIRYVHTICLVSLLSLLQACTGIGRDSDRGFTGFGKVPPAVWQSPLVTYCPAPGIERIEYACRRFTGTAVMGREIHQLVARRKGITSLAISSAGDRPLGLPGLDRRQPERSRMLTCGGLINLALAETASPGCDGIDQPDLGHWPRPERRFMVQRISDFQGMLFPLRVGNELSFQYMARLSAWTGSAGCGDEHFSKHAHYSVLGVNDAFSVGGVDIPGRVYLIEHTLSDPGGGNSVKRDYYFSEALGWVVLEVEYSDGNPGVVRELTRWHASAR